MHKVDKEIFSDFLNDRLKKENFYTIQHELIEHARPDINESNFNNFSLKSFCITKGPVTRCNFLTNCNAILLLGDVKLANTCSINYSLLIYF